MNIKQSIIVIMLFFVSIAASRADITTVNEPGKCNLAITYAEMAYINFKKAYNSSSDQDINSLLEKGVSQSTQASAYSISSGCNCSLAKNYALNAVTFGNKARKAKNAKDRKKFIKQAMNAANSVMVGANTCN